MTIKVDIKFVANNKEYGRQITVTVSKTGATGNVMNGEAKTGFFRWNRGYKYPMFFSSKGAKLVGAQPLNLAIASAVKEVCAAMRQKQTPPPTNPDTEEELAAGGEW